jgi:hypothetical protein
MWGIGNWEWGMGNGELGIGNWGDEGDEGAGEEELLINDK